MLIQFTGSKPDVEVGSRTKEKKATFSSRIPSYDFDEEDWGGGGQGWVWEPGTM